MRTSSRCGRLNGGTPATLDAIPLPKEVADKDLESIYLDDNDGRQLLHITYGSVLSEKDASGALPFRTRFFDVLNAALLNEVQKFWFSVWISK